MARIETEEILRIAKNLEKIAKSNKPDDDSLAMLRRLQERSITVDQLQITRIGAVLNEFRKQTSNEKCASIAKSLIKHWKKYTVADAGGDPSSHIPPQKPDTPQLERIASNVSVGSSSVDGDTLSQRTIIRTMSGNDDVKENGNSDTGASTDTDQPPRIAHKSASVDTPMVKSGGDDVRDKGREMLLNSFKKYELPDGTLDPETIAAQIESALYEMHNGASEKYKTALRSRVFNLRDKKSQELRDNILTGVIRPERFAAMTSEEMASGEMKKLREMFTKESLNEYQLTTEAGTPTDMFKCGKCKKKDCTYRQAQTRSADEPMTTFVWCRSCGNRWKFS